jgi:MSHA biogenesis protein MshP
MNRRLLHTHRSAGFAIVTAIFIIVALAALSAAIVSLVRTQQTGSALDTEGARAYQAARAGMEWGAYRSLRDNSCVAATSIALGGSLGAYVATVGCTRSTHNEAGTNLNIDTIVATACNQPAAGNCPNPAPGAAYAERQISIMVGHCGAVPCP